jgi:hypothetical protein
MVSSGRLGDNLAVVPARMASHLEVNLDLLELLDHESGSRGGVADRSTASG